MTDFETTPTGDFFASKRSKGEKSTKTMTYREWLIGQIASGVNPSIMNTQDRIYATMQSIKLADEIIKQLDDEQ